MIPYSDWLLGHYVSLDEMLDGREQRACRQRSLLDKGGTLLCFTLNLAGPLKVFPLSEELFRWGDREVRNALSAVGLRLLEAFVLPHSFGWEGYYRVDGSPVAVKRAVLPLEEEYAAGRLFDLDVLGATGEKLSRGQFGLPARPCLICGAAGADCASSRVHSVARLQRRSVELILDAVRAEELSPEMMGGLCRMALLHEVYTTPKPGLVDRANNGSHKDMDIPLFEASAAALEPCFADLFRLGWQLCDVPPCKLLPQLRERGIQGENEMKRMTHGINTHKGAVFSLGLLCAALGQLRGHNAKKEKDGGISLDSWMNWAGAIAAPALRQNFTALRSRCPDTAGERQYQDQSLLGIRREAASGFQSVRFYSWPALLQGLQDGQNLETAGVPALMELIAHVSDSNVIARGGVERAEQLRKLVRAQKETTVGYATEWVEELDQTLIQWNISPGGCADLLSVTYLIALLMELGFIT